MKQAVNRIAYPTNTRPQLKHLVQDATAKRSLTPEPSLCASPAEPLLPLSRRGAPSGVGPRLAPGCRLPLRGDRVLTPSVPPCLRVSVC